MLKAAIARIQTDSRLPGEPKDPDESHLFTIYRAFAGQEEVAAFRQQLLDGMGWGDAKQALGDLLENTLAPMRERYNELMSRPDQIEEILQEGAQKARREATPFMNEIRQAVGLRNALAVKATPKEQKKTTKVARFVSFRDENGRFRFRLIAASGRELLLSIPFDNPKDAGLVTKRLQTANILELITKNELGGSFEVKLDGQVVANGFPTSSSSELDANIKLLNEAIESMKA